MDNIEIIPPNRALPALAEPHPSTLPPAPEGWEKAELPKLYRVARDALAACERVDECLEWKRKAEAFASYYRQAQDRSLYNTAVRIRLRAWRRCGELFLEMDAADLSDGNINSHQPGKAKSATREADRLGMSTSDRREARQLAKIPEEEFERQIEQEPVPTVNKLLKAVPYPNLGISAEARAAASVLHALERIFNAAHKEIGISEIVACLPHDQLESAEFMSGLVVDWLALFRDEAMRQRQRGARRPATGTSDV